MEQIVRSRARVPAINCGSRASSARLDRHLAVLGGPAVPPRESVEAISLMRELTMRDHVRAKETQGARLSLFAPLRRLRRSLFGNRS
ncbi:MAG: hypothetical protein JO362_03220 [Streptomycetaceae bacterium]|nr:hypothetical protein [Streptomycetaceae bacterium]